jgi:hypothetical protein
MAKRGTTKFKSNLQERQVANDLLGRVQIASGALDDKADVRSKDFLCECKTTEKDSYTLKVDTWNKIQKEAYKLGLCPIMCIQTNDEGVNLRQNKMYCLMRKADFDYYLARKLDSVLPVNEPSIILMKKQSKVCRNDFEIISSEFLCGEESYPKLVLFPWDNFIILIED